MESGPSAFGLQPVVLQLPKELLSKMVDSDSRSAFRLCCKTWRDAIDSTIRGLKVTYGSAIPDQQPPEPVACVEESLRGLLRRGCQPHSLSLRLDEEDAQREAKGSTVLGVLAATRSLKELRLHGLPLSPTVAPTIAAAAPFLAKLSLSGACTSRESLQSGLATLLDATPHLEGLTLLNMTTGSAQAAWQPLSEHAALRSLYLHFIGRSKFDAAETEVLVAGLSSLTQLTALSLDLSVDQPGPLSAVLPAMCAALTRLRSLSLHTIMPPDNLLQCLAGLPALESLSVRCSHVSPRQTDGVQDVAFLPQLTALTSLSLSAPLSPSSLERAIADGAAWALPPRLRALRLNKPLRLVDLAALVPPTSLVSVRLSPEPMELPQTAQAAARQLAEVVPRLAAWGIDPMALKLPARGDHSVWIRELAPLQLRGLRLCGEALQEEDAAALAAALGCSLIELTLEESGPSLMRMLPGLLRLRCLRTLVVSGLELPGPFRERGGGRAVGRGREYTLGQPLQLVSADAIVRMQAEAAAAAATAAAAAAAAGASDPAAMEAAGRAAAAAEAAERVLAEAVQEASLMARLGRRLTPQDMTAVLEEALLVLLAHGINVRLKDYNRWITDACAVVSQRIRSSGGGAKWGRL